MRRSRAAAALAVAGLTWTLGAPSAAADDRAAPPSARAASPGCELDAAPGRQSLRVTSGGLTYAVPVHVPSGYDPTTATPAVVALHGARPATTLRCSRPSHR